MQYFGENGLIRKAELSKDVHRGSSVEEAVNLWKATKELDKYMNSSDVQTKEELIDDLVKQGLLTSEEKTTIEETGSVTIGGKTISFAKTLVEMFDAGELKIGDYVNYKNPTSGEYTAPGTQTGMQNFKDNGSTVANDDLNQAYRISNNQLTWRILGKDEATGGLKLIAGSPMKKESTSNNPYLMMYGAQSYISGPEELDKICAMYKNDLAQKARSVNMDDINAITGITTVDKIKEVNLDPHYGGKQYGDAYSFENQYTPESWLNGKKQTTVSGTVDGYYYAINAPADQVEVSVTMTNTRLYDLLFKDVEIETGKAYWLASRGVSADSGGAACGPGAVYTGDGITSAGTNGMFYSVNGYEYYIGFVVRPVVVLKSDVTADDIQKIADQVETPWNNNGGGPQ